MPEYAELHCHSWFSLLDGASSVERLVERAAALNMPALALTDHDAVYGAPRFARAAEAAGLRAIFGAELTTSAGHLTLLVENERGWANLCALITQARQHAEKGSALLPFEAIEGHTGGLIALSGCRKGPVAAALLRQDPPAAQQIVQRLREWFGRDRLFIELQHHRLLHDEALIHALARLARAAGLAVVATHNVHYATPEGRRLHDVMTCIRHGVSLDEAGRRLRLNAEYSLLPAAGMAERFAAWPQALAATLEIAERCRFELRSGVQDLPVFPLPAGQAATGYLQDLCRAGISRRYGEPSEPVLRQVGHELAVIDRAGLSNYFLILHDLIRFARGRGIRCQGRGSAANSLVAYLLDITPVDPLRHALLFERFLSAERQTTPDVDIDFDAERREEVIQYVYQRYGQAHAAMACTLVTYRARSALRDVGKALNLPPEVVAEAAKWLDTNDPQKLADSPDLKRALGSRWMTGRWTQLLDLCRQLDGAPRHLGIHNGGMVITGPPLSERLPTEPATMPGRVVVQWDKDALEDAGMVKIDILGLRMLSAISEAAAHAEALTGQPLNLDRLTFDDPAVYRMVSAADTIGVFQVESRAQAQVLPRLRPRCFNDLIVSISLIRPGPVQGQMVHPYLRRRDGSEPVTYLDPRLEPALSETLGVVLFQEQVLKVARDIAGFTPGQGELLRRALGSKRAGQELAALEADFVAGAARNGVSEETARQIYGQLRGFAGYSFPKSHAAAFAVLVYQSAWLRRYHPLPFYLGLLNHQPMGFWSPAVILGDAERRGIRALRPDVERSPAKCAPEDGHIRLGLGQVKGLREADIERILAARPFRGLADFYRRTRIPRRLAEHCILAGALDSFGERRALLWELGAIPAPGSEETLLDPPLIQVDLPRLTAAELMAHEYALLGLTVQGHPMRLVRERLNREGVVSSRGLSGIRDRQRVRTAGQIVVHQSPPTAKGMHFVTLEDETGMTNVVVRPDIYRAQREIWRKAPALIVEGVVQKRNGVVNFVAERVKPLAG